MGSAVFRQVYSDLIGRHGGVDSRGIVVDVGAKDAEIAASLGREFGATAVAVDLEFDVAPGVRDSVTCVRGNGRRLPFATGSVDAVVSNTLLEHVPDESRFIREAARILKPEGLAVFIFPNRAWPLDRHGFPPFTPWVPREVGRALVARWASRPRAEYYQRAMHPVWSLTVRRTMSRCFDDVRYESGRLTQVHYRPDNRRGRVLQSIGGALRLAIGIPLTRPLVEAIFPVSIYAGTVPNR